MANAFKFQTMSTQAGDYTTFGLTTSSGSTLGTLHQMKTSVGYTMTPIKFSVLLKTGLLAVNFTSVTLQAIQTISVSLLIK